jgi:effector-binding domain-containing protein
MWVIFLAALFVAIAYFLPREVYVERDTKINAAARTVYAQIADLRSWNKWSVWNQIDPNMEISYTKHGVGAGAGYSWESNNRRVGNGSLEITTAQAFDSVLVNIQFAEQGIVQNGFVFSAENNATKVKWYLRYELGNNPLSRWMGLMMPKNIGSDLETGLSNLKGLCQAIEQENEYVVTTERIKNFHFASIRETVPLISISLKMGEMYGEISQLLARTETEMAGMPFSLYHLMNEQEVDMECGIPTQELIEGTDKIAAASFPETKCAIVYYYGDYQNLQEGHTAVQKWITERGFELTGPPMEIYLTDPGLEPNPENWITKIAYPVN